MEYIVDLLEMIGKKIKKVFPNGTWLVIYSSSGSKQKSPETNPCDKLHFSCKETRPTSYQTHPFLTHTIHGTGIFTYIYHKNQPNVGKYTIHGWYG